MLRFVALLAAVGAASACSRRSSWNGGGSGSVVIGSPNIPATVPPTPQPTPPPPPPPLPEGWLQPAFKSGGAPLQKQTRKNCDRRVDLKNVGTAADPEIQEEWVYTCSFNVYIQTEIATTEHPQHCGCSLAYAREQDAEGDAAFEAAYDTQITRVEVVVYDPVRNEVKYVFPEFSNMRQNENLTQALRSSAATATMDYSMAMQSFADLVQPIESLPAALDTANPENTNHIAAFCFQVQEEYRTQYRWPQPPVPVLSQQPNIWATNCIPWENFPASATAKRQEGAATTLWWREFMTFPTTDTFATTGGFNPAARLIRSFYKNSRCDTTSAVTSFEKEFRFRLSHETTFDMFGAFAFFRQYKTVSVIGGAPQRFHAGAQMTFSGFVQIDWHEPYSRATNNAFRPGVAAHALLGTPATGANLDMPFIGATADTKLCNDVPAEWTTCQDPTACTLVKDTNPYGENVVVYHLADNAITGNLDCAPAYLACPEETTFLSAINSGLYGRDFTIRPDSLLAVGPRQDLCLDYPTIAAFDSITFSAIKSGTEVVKRGSAQLSQPTEIASHFKFMKRSQLDDRYIVLPTSPEGEPALGAPTIQDRIVQAAGGSANAEGRPSGDHPVRMFPETYAVPVSVDPADIDMEYSHGRLVTGAAAACIEGSQGCTCRTRRGRPRCDAPLTCSSGDEFPADENAEVPKGFCQLPVCLAGEAGCECDSSSGCKDDSLTCHDNTCVFKRRCTPGDVGCSCDAGSCSSGQCDTLNNVCLARDCPPGLPGCACREHPNGGSMWCFAEQGLNVPVTLEATEAYTAENANFMSLVKGDRVVVESQADINPNGDDVWVGKLNGATQSKNFPISKMRIAAYATPQYVEVNAFVCQADTVCSNPDAAVGKLGAACTGNINCESGSCVSGFCAQARCTPGSSGCQCKDDDSCDGEFDECSPNNICVTPTCQSGDGGCACSLGRCRAGFECSVLDGEAEGRCVKERCDPGTRGCPCKQENGALTCVDDKFSCVALKTDGSDKRCLAEGTSCRSQTARCIEYCGANNVDTCPPCDHQVPICIREPGVAAVDNSSASALAASMAVLVAIVFALF